jgi:ABC-type multidrug transport system ATPase subunit
VKAVTVEGLTKRFESVVALDAISLEVDAGELFGFIGPEERERRRCFAFS